MDDRHHPEVFAPARLHAVSAVDLRVDAPLVRVKAEAVAVVSKARALTCLNLSKRRVS